MEYRSRVGDYLYAFKFEEASKLPELNRRFESPCFKVGILEDTNWKIICRFFNQSGNLFLSIFIKNTSTSFKPTQFELTLSVLSADPSLYVSRKVKVTAATNKRVCGFDKFMRYEELLAKRKVYLPQDTLTILCYIVRQKGIEDFTIGEKGKKAPQSESYSLNNDLYSLYLDGKFSDIKIETLDQTFSVHKTVLCARSPVFCAMFENNTKEKVSGTIKITDLDSETVNLLLTFLYSDSIENLNQDQAKKLYMTADLYNIPLLKQQCACQLKKCLSYVNVLETFILADMLGDDDLKLAAEGYMFIYSNRMIKSYEWKVFMQSNYKLSGEIMYKLWMKNLENQV